MNREEMEFLISQHLDGALSHEEEAKVRELLASNEEARAILAEYQKLDGILKGQAAPAVQWDLLAEKISSAVAAQTLDEKDELAVSEYVDGTLADVDRAALEVRMQSEPGLRAVMEDYRALDGAVRASMPMPAVKWDVLAERISESIDADSQRQRLFIGNWLKQPMRLAAAAVVLIALGLTILIMLSRGGGGAQPVMAFEVVGPEKPAGEAVAKMEFDMSPTVAQSGTDFYSVGDVVTMPSTIDVAFGTPVLPDSSPF